MQETDARIAKRLGAAIRERRKSRGWSQAVLAERIDVSVDYVGLLERGARTPALGTLVALARALGATVDELLGGAAAPKRDNWADEALWLLQALPGDVRPTVLAMVDAAVRENSSRSGVRRRRA